MSKLTKREKELGYCEEAQTYCSVAEERYQQGRVDEQAKMLNENGYLAHICEDRGYCKAIEEFLKKDKECQQKSEECPYMYSEISCVECIAEQLKEQK